MDADRYKQILELVTLHISATPHFKAISSKMKAPIDTIHSIYSQEMQMRVIKSHKKICGLAPSLAARYLRGADLLELCYEVDLPPCTVIRRVIEHLPLGLQGSKRTTEILRDPDALFNIISEGQAQQAGVSFSPPITPSAPIDLCIRLVEDIRRCVDCDIVCSPASDSARQVAGRTYEDRLYDALTKAGIAFWTEEALRSGGFIKTPDAHLQVPVAVHGRVVCWIDSKATFGDERTHEHQLQEQYQRYVNRFGPGLVIYWHGFLEILNSKDQDVLVLDSFPSAKALTVLPQVPLDVDQASANCAPAAPVSQL